VRPEWSDLELYRPPQAPVAINLSDNTSRFGVPPAALAVLRDESMTAVTRYPDTYASPLKEALAGYAGVTPAEIATGCGSDDILDSSFRAFARPGERLAYLAPTFPMAAYFARMNGIASTSTPLSPDGTFDPELLLAGDPALVYLCTPNNPTGAALDPAAVERVLARARGVVIVDEAYAEFAGPGWLARAPRLPGVLVARTMSKAFGLAGLRVGYACGSAELVQQVELSRGPFKVTSVAERVATAAVRHDVDWVRARAAEAVTLRERLADELRARGFAPLPSAANFVLVPVPGAPRVAAAMRARGVAVRPFAALPGIGDALRITAAPWNELELALAALTEALACE
jgi:histidinol-phosphate aminotransferase